MKVLVVIVNYRTSDFVIACLRSLADEIAVFGGVRDILGGCDLKPSPGTPGEGWVRVLHDTGKGPHPCPLPEYREREKEPPISSRTPIGDAAVIVVDNASGDGSVARIERAIRESCWSGWTSVMPLTSNGGFACGNNAAIEPALASTDPPEYVYLLNPDTLMKPGGIRELIKFLDEHPQVGIAGGGSVNGNGLPLSAGFRFHSVLGELEGGIRLGIVSRLLKNHIVATGAHDSAQQVDWVVGASMMVRREVFDSIGLFDPNYFMYFEEVDFCMRAREARWPTWIVPASQIVHLVGASSGVTSAERHEKRRPRYWFESRHRFFVRHHGRFKTVLADLAFGIGYAVHRTLDVLRGRPRTDPPWLLWDFFRYNLTSWSHR